MDFLLSSKNKSLSLMLFLSLALFSASCSPLSVKDGNAETKRGNQTASENVVKDDLGELMNVIRLPELPDEKEVVWKIETVAKPDSASNGANTKLTAVLKYDDATSAKLISQIEKQKAPELTEIEAENWFPEELIAQAQMSGNETLKGTAYGANDFLNTPYGTGKITRVEGTNYFILELFAQ